MQSSQGQVLVSNFVASQAGQVSGVIPLPLKPHLLQVNSSWILLQEVGMWSASMSKTKSAPNQPFLSMSKSGFS